MEMPLPEADAGRLVLFLTTVGSSRYDLLLPSDTARLVLWTPDEFNVENVRLVRN